MNIIEIKKFKFASNLDFVYQGLREKKISCKVDWENNILYCEEKDKETISNYINSLNLDENDVEVDESIIEGYEEWNKNMYNPGHYTGGNTPFFNKEKENYAFYGFITIISGTVCLLQIVNEDKFSTSVFWISLILIVLIAFSLFYQHIKKTKK